MFPYEGRLKNDWQDLLLQLLFLPIKLLRTRVTSAYLENVFLKVGLDWTVTSWESEAFPSQLAVTEI